MSRLIPLSPLRGCVLRDPKAFDPQPSQRLVQLFTRGDEPVEIEFDPTHPVAADMQKRLELINAVNSTCTITFTPYDPWQLDFVGIRRLRPVHRARFTEQLGVARSALHRALWAPVAAEDRTSHASSSTASRASSWITAACTLGCFITGLASTTPAILTPCGERKRLVPSDYSPRQL